MKQEDIIRMARESGMAGFDGVVHAAFQLEAFAALVAAEEREACAKVAGRLWQKFQNTRIAHERNSLEPFKPERFGFDHSTFLSKEMMDAIRARGNT
jgi:hypothetical protein